MSFHFLNRSSLFLHIPKTGGTWVEHATYASGIEIEAAPVRGTASPRHALINQYLNSYRFFFAFVRHPLSWYESWWKFQTWLNWREHNPGGWHPQRLLEKCASDDFAEFVRLCIRLEPSYVSRMYEWYLGPQGTEFVGFVGRYEYLASDLVMVYRALGLEFDEAALRETAPENVSLSPFGKPSWDDELKARILELERPAIRRFYSNEGGA